MDERLTSVEAERLMRDAGASLEERKNQSIGWQLLCYSKVIWGSAPYRRARTKEARLANQSGALRRFFRLMTVAVAISVLVGCAFAGYWYLGPYRGFRTETFVEIEHGMSSREIARQLARERSCAIPLGL